MCNDGLHMLAYMFPNQEVFCAMLAIDFILLKWFGEMLLYSVGSAFSAIRFLNVVCLFCYGDRIS